MPNDRAKPRPPWSQLARILHRASLVILLVFIPVFILLVGALRAYPLPYVYPALPRVTHTAQGVAGDPLNVLLIGSQDQIATSFAQAGWLVPDPITPATSARIAAASLAHQPYPAAPVSNLYAFGRVQDLAFEWPTGDVQNRGHIRLWLTTLQMNGQAVWLGAASYDQGIELSGATKLPTHHISPAVDLERDTVGTDLQRSGLVAAEVYDPYTAPAFVAYNGGGDYYVSDGEALIVSLSRAALPLPTTTGSAALIAGLTGVLWSAYAAVVTSPLLSVVALAGLALLLLLALWPVLSTLWSRVFHRRIAPGAPGAPGRA